MYLFLYLDKAVCKHLIVICIKNSLPLFGVGPKVKVFIVRRNRKYKRIRLVDSDDESGEYVAPEDLPEEEDGDLDVINKCRCTDQRSSYKI